MPVTPQSHHEEGRHLDSPPHRLSKVEVKMVTGDTVAIRQISPTSPTCRITVTANLDI